MKQVLEERGRDFEQFDETDEEAADRLQVSVDDARLEREDYLLMFGDGKQFSKLSYVRTDLKDGDRDANHTTEMLKRQGLPEGAQFNTNQPSARGVGNSIYVTCAYKHTQRIQDYMRRNGLHKVEVDMEPELTMMVEAYTCMHAKVAMMVGNSETIASLVKESNEQVERIEHTEDMGKWIEEEAETMRVEHVAKKTKSNEDVRMEEAEKMNDEVMSDTDEETPTFEVVHLVRNQKVALFQKVTKYIDEHAA
jgi:hypothetical protein